MKKTLIFMSDSRGYQEGLPNSDANIGYLTIVARLNAQYAKRHGYAFLYVQTPGAPGDDPKLGVNSHNTRLHSARSSPWTKLLSFWAMLRRRYERVVYIDSDCAFVRPEVSLDRYLERARFLEGDRTKPLVFLANYPWGKWPCSGFFVAQTGVPARRLAAEWWNTAVPEKDRAHPFEQAALHLLWRLPGFREACGVIDDWMFEDRPRQFLRHIGILESKRRVPRFRRFYEQLWGDANPKVRTLVLETAAVEQSLQRWAEVHEGGKDAT